MYGGMWFSGFAALSYFASVSGVFGVSLGDVRFRESSFFVLGQFLLWFLIAPFFFSW